MLITWYTGEEKRFSRWEDPRSVYFWFTSVNYAMGWKSTFTQTSVWCTFYKPNDLEGGYKIGYFHGTGVCVFLFIIHFILLTMMVRNGVFCHTITLVVGWSKRVLPSPAMYSDCSHKAGSECIFWTKRPPKSPEHRYKSLWLWGWQPVGETLPAGWDFPNRNKTEEASCNLITEMKAHPNTQTKFSHGLILAGERTRLPAGNRTSTSIKSY